MATSRTPRRGEAAMCSTSSANRMARPLTAPSTRTGEVRILQSAFCSRQSAIRQRGFTLVELLIVISLISILAAMGLVQYRNSVVSAKESVLVTDLFRMRDAIDQYYADKGKYPSSLDSLVSDGYMRKIPEDPITKSSDTWTTVPAEPDPNNPSAEPGIY